MPAYTLNPTIDLSVKPTEVSLNRVLELLGVGADKGGINGTSWWQRVRGNGPKINTAKGTDALKMMESLVTVGKDGKVYLADQELAEALRKVRANPKGATKLTDEGRKIQNYLAQVTASSQDFAQVAAEGHAMLTSKFVQHRAKVSDALEAVTTAIKTGHNGSAWITGGEDGVKTALTDLIKKFEESGTEIVVSGSGSDATFKIRDFLTQKLKVTIDPAGAVTNLGDITSKADSVLESVRSTVETAMGKLRKAQDFHLEMFEEDLLPALESLAERTKPLAEQLSREVELATGVKMPEVYLNGSKTMTRLSEGAAEKESQQLAENLVSNASNHVADAGEKAAEWGARHWAGAGLAVVGAGDMVRRLASDNPENKTAFGLVTDTLMIGGGIMLTQLGKAGTAAAEVAQKLHIDPGKVMSRL